MTDVLPVIIDPEPIENTENLENNVKPVDDEVFSDEELSEEMEEPVKVEKRPKIDNKVIFQEPPSVKPVVKKKRVMDEKKLEQLAKARAKANATRTAKKEAKLKAKKEAEEAQAQMAQQKIQEKTNEYVEKKVEKIKKQVDREPVIVQKSSVSLEDIEKIVGGAISKYDNDRLIRKEQKKKKKEEEEKHAKINATIKRAQGRPLKPHEEGFFDSCFG
tara:strand:- start:101 stop:751 length:651 start_codon:yes stop_codon:yes gene_type:complete